MADIISGEVEVDTYTPADIPDIQLWLDSADASTITQSAGAVSQWDDKSGEGHNATQPTGSLQPTTGTRTINGLNVIDFSNDSLVIGVNATQGNTIIALVSFDNLSNANFLFDGNDQYDRQILFNVNGAYAMFADDTISNGSIPQATTQIWMGEFNGSSSQLIINGTTQLTGNPGSDNLAGLRIGARYNGVNPLDGVMGDFIIVDKIMTTTEKNQLGNFLANKWGITWSDIT